MLANRCAPQRGVFWWAEGARLCLKNPLVTFSASATYVLLSPLLLGLLGSFGVALVLILQPAISSWIMSIFDKLSRGSQESSNRFLNRKKQFPPLVRLGLLALLAYFCAASLTLWLFGEPFFEVFKKISEYDDPSKIPEAIGIDFIRTFLPLMSCYLLLTFPIAILFWFTPHLVVWWSQPIKKAFFFSLVACQINWASFSVYGLVPIGLLFFSAALGTFIPALGALLMMSITLMLIPITCASFYGQLIDIFGNWPDAEAA